MQTKRLAGLATFLVAVLVASCQVTTEQSVVVNGNQGPVVIFRSDTVGNCVTVTNMHMNGTGSIAGGGINMRAGDIADLSVSEIFNPPGCGAPRTFRWESSGTTKVSVLRIDSVTGRITAISSGTSMICAVDENDSSFRLCVMVTVLGGTNPTCQITGLTATSNDSSLTVGQTTQVTATQTTNGVAGCNPPTFRASGTVSVNATGLVTAVSVGTGTVTVTSGDGNRTVSITIMVSTINTTSTIDYAPTGVTPAGDTTLTATCVQGTDIANVCEPFWTSSDPSHISVRGNTAKVVSGFTFWVGMTATMTRVAPGSAVICNQWSLTQSVPAKCYDR